MNFLRILLVVIVAILFFPGGKAVHSQTQKKLEPVAFIAILFDSDSTGYTLRADVTYNPNYFTSPRDVHLTFMQMFIRNEDRDFMHNFIEEVKFKQEEEIIRQSFLNPKDSM